MNEIEVKVLNINSELIKEKLNKLNAKLVKKEFQINYMFDFENNLFFDKGGYVRIRNSHDFIHNKQKIVLTSKELISREKFKISKEIEFNSDDFESSKDFLLSLGLKLRRVDEKYRESYQLEQGLVEIDTWAGVPTYLEVEAETEEKVIEILSLLDFKLEDSTSMTLAEIMKHYNIKDDNRTFSAQDKKQMGL